MITLALLCTGICATATAQAQNPNGWFVNAGVGTPHYDAKLNGFKVDGSNSSTSFQMNAGWRWQTIGVEAGYVDLGNLHNSLDSNDFAKYPYGTPYSSVNYKLSTDGWTLGLNGHFNPTDKWYVSARGGLFMWKARSNETVVPTGSTAERYSSTNRSTDWYAGVGTGMDVNRHVSLGVNFDYYKMKKDSLNIGNRMYSVNFEYRF
ncbi:porin family protein [Oleiagrimonas citrea]|uniref:Porin family protein n=1 Tax=Oleiagrimonas citrea TaxID=1665687 RepID=A0A846ZJ41_9GAMM|nr:porin family protein [Oleiagrimonas citrea]NKZ38305.1 porin family protein [Oleiagrimonas citrea]